MVCELDAKRHKRQCLLVVPAMLDLQRDADEPQD